MNRDYLPSKNFVIRISSILIIILVIFGITKLVTYFRNKANNNEPVKLLVKNIIDKDGNSNDIPDWEEFLWGLNPNKDGEKNKEFILNKRKELSSNNLNKENDSTELSDNDQLSKEFFSIIFSLEQSGALNEESIGVISEAFNQKIEPILIPDIYTDTMIKINKDVNKASENYLVSIGEIIEKYADKNIGDELIFITEGMKNGDPTAMRAVLSVAQSYKDFGADLMKISVPQNKVDIHLKLANDYYKTGVSVEGLAQVLDNPIIGMSSILNYKKYSDSVVSDYSLLSDSL